MSHTPGPWKTLIARSLVNIKGANGEQVCQVRVERPEDARLIAAAPDLLEACKAVLHPDLPGFVATSKNEARIRAAIAKATGAE